MFTDMTKPCPYCASLVIGAGLVDCRGCGSPIAMGAVLERSESLEISVAVNRISREQIVFGVLAGRATEPQRKPMARVAARATTERRKAA